MVTAIVGACALVVLVGVLALVLRRARLRSNRQTEAVLRNVDGHLGAISASVAQAIDRLVEARGDRPVALLTLDFDSLVDALVAEAAARTGADAVVLRVEGPGQRPVVASVGHDADAELLEQTFGPPDARPFGAATIEWVYAPIDEPDAQLFRSALVTPVGASAHVPGVVAVFSSSPGAFRAEQATALRALVEDAEVALANARRFADVEARIYIDPTTGVPNRRGYELELEREVARAQRTGRPLSVLLVGLPSPGPETSDRSAPGLGEMARLLTRVTRGTDISCRRGERELAILLPETRETGATRLTSRLREEARRALEGESQTTFAVGYAEWRPNESVASLDARAEAALTRPLVGVQAATETSPHAPSAAPQAVDHGPPGHPGRRAYDRDEPPADELRSDALDALARTMLDARRLDGSLALVVLDVDGLGDVAERLGRDVADDLLGDIARGLDRGVGGGSVHRLGPAEFALVLVESSVDDAEALVGTLQASFELPDAAERLTLRAGVTELLESDDAHGALGRAEHALWQAKQAGPGTVVVALPGSRSPRST